MTGPDMRGKVQTVLGPIDAADLGVTLPHEHCLFDLSMWFSEPGRSSERFRAYQPVSIENLGWVRYHPYNNKDNWIMLDEEVAIKELARFRRFGGQSLVDMSNYGLGRDPEALARIARATGLNIIMGSGYYLEPMWPEGLTEEKMVDSIVRDITEGADGAGIRSGLIGEIGTERFGPDKPMSAGYHMALRATATAQKATGAPVNIHPGHSPDSPIEIVRYLAAHGADVTRVAISHIDRTVFLHDMRVELAKTGCYLEYDMFSFEGWHQTRHVLSEQNPVPVEVPNDAGRVAEIVQLVEAGFINQILISHDHCSKHRLFSWGGPGYAHILENIAPLLMSRGLTREQVETITVANPRRFLQFV
jgi:phosphotriesterase-related protein